MKRVSALVVLVALTACSDSTKGVPELPPSPSAERSQAGHGGAAQPDPAVPRAESTEPLAPEATCPGEVNCSTCAADLRSWMQALAKEGYEDEALIWSEPEEVLVSSSLVTSRLPPSYVVTVAEGAFHLNPLSIAKRPTTQWHIRRLHNNLARRWNERCDDKKDLDRWSVILQVASETPWRVLRDVVATIEAAGADEVVFAVLKKSAVAPPVGLEPPPDPWQEAAPLDGPVKLRVDTLFANCEAAREASRKYKNEGRERFFVDTLPGAIETCQCQVNVEDVKALVWRGSRRELKGLYHTGIALTLADGKVPKRVALPAEMPWSEAYKSLPLGGGAVYLDIAGSDVDIPEGRPASDCSSRKARMPAEDDRDIYRGLLGDFKPDMSKSGISGLRVEGELPAKVIRDYVQRESWSFQQCAVTNQVVGVSFTINEHGRVKRAKTTLGRDTTKCIRNTLRLIEFPMPRSGDRVKVSFDLELARN